uniref:Uncharacterized protein n=1 Tax=Fagus sylvatica TaxID=28930 RepID=A0A2N9EXD2_FAGSY
MAKSSSNNDPCSRVTQIIEAKAQVEDVERKRLEAEEEKKRQVNKAEEERIAEIERRAGGAKGGKIDKANCNGPMVLVQQVVQPAIEVRTSIEAATLSIEATSPLAPHMQEGLGDIDKLLEDVSLTFQQCQTPTKTSSTSISLEPSRDQLQIAIS